MVGGPLGDPHPAKVRGGGSLWLAPPVEMHPPRKKHMMCLPCTTNGGVGAQRGGGPGGCWGVSKLPKCLEMRHICKSEALKRGLSWRPKSERHRLQEGKRQRKRDQR